MNKEQLHEQRRRQRTALDAQKAAAGSQPVIPVATRAEMESAVRATPKQSTKHGPNKRSRDVKMDKFRLPDGAHFQAVYHAASQTWEAVLSVGDYQAMQTGPGIHWCLMQLGQRWHKENQNKGA